MDTHHSKFTGVKQALKAEVRYAMTMHDSAPNFSLPDQNGKVVSLSDYHGQWLVLYFYPKDESLNCTAQACSFRDENVIIAQFGNAAIIGINPGSVESHKKFSDKNHINFPLLSDQDHQVTSAYGAWRTRVPGPLKSVFGTKRNTYLINPEGEIVKVYLNVNPKSNVTEIIKDLQEMQGL